MTASLQTLQIGLIVSAKQTSGSDRYFFNLLRALPASGVGACGVILGDPDHAADPVAGVSSFAPEGTGTLTRWRGLRRTIPPLLRGRTMVVSHFAPHVFPVLDQIRALPLVVHFHGPWALEGRADGVGRRSVLVRSIEEKIVYRRARRLIVLSRAFGDILQRDYGVPADNIRVVPGGVDVARFAPAASRADARRALGWPLDRPIAVTVRRMEPTKGIENLIEAVDALRKRIPDVFVVCAGTGQLLQRFRDRVAERSLERWIQFPGLVPEANLPLLYRAADVSIVPTVAFEGFGLVVLESLAAGTPALVTPVTGLPEVVRDLDPGLILSGSQVNDLARGLDDALSGRQTLPDERACIAYAERFAWSSIAERVRSVYEEVA